MRCGGGRGQNATYSAEGRTEGSTCEVCAPISNGFAYYYRGNQTSFIPAVVTQVGADSPGACLAEFAQLMDAAWFIGGSVQLEKVSGVSSFEACVKACRTTDDCQYVNYNYEASLAADNTTFVPECMIKRLNTTAAP